jgi:hypothetical protein
MLDELCALTEWSRRHAIRALAQAIDPPKRSERPPRPRLYGPEVLGPLRVVWATLNGPAGKRLAPFMAEIVSALERCGELELSPEVRDKLLRISAATIDRLLAPERARLRVKGRQGTKPGSILNGRSRSGPSPSGTRPVPGSARWTLWLNGPVELDQERQLLYGSDLSGYVYSSGRGSRTAGRTPAGCAPDRFFTPMYGPTLPAHLYAVAASSNDIVDNKLNADNPGNYCDDASEFSSKFEDDLSKREVRDILGRATAEASRAVLRRQAERGGRRGGSPTQRPDPGLASRRSARSSGAGCQTWPPGSRRWPASSGRWTWSDSGPRPPTSSAASSSRSCWIPSPCTRITWRSRLAARHG